MTAPTEAEVRDAEATLAEQEALEGREREARFEAGAPLVDQHTYPGGRVPEDEVLANTHTEMDAAEYAETMFPRTMASLRGALGSAPFNPNSTIELRKLAICYVTEANAGIVLPAAKLIAEAEIVFQYLLAGPPAPEEPEERPSAEL